MEAPAGGEAAKAFRCLRSQKDLPLSQPRCADPAAYCKGRAACPIHHLQREEARASR
ncbi:MAG: hypothetical protein ACYDA8_07975 [Deferrisomatales bacterium]